MEHIQEIRTRINALGVLSRLTSRQLSTCRVRVGFKVCGSKDMGTYSVRKCACKYV